MFILLTHFSPQTSNSTRWALYLLAKNPEKQECLYQELSQILPPDGVADEAAVRKMHYMKALIKESLRY